MKVDAGRLRQAMAAPSSAVRLYLLHGSDEVGMQAAAHALATALGSDAERIDLDGTMLRRQPGLLADEATSPSLFGTTRYVRASAIGEESLEALTLLLGLGRVDAPVVAIAPAVRTTAKIVKLAIESPLAMACAFYPPTAAEAERIAAALARDEGLAAEPGVLRRLVEMTGGDRSMLAQEVAKLALFLDADGSRPRPLDHATLDALGADHGDASVPALVAALVDGEPALLGEEIERIEGDGGSPVTWLRAVERRLLALAEMRSAVDRGEAPAAVMKHHRVFFREEAATLSALRRWSPAMLTRAIDRMRTVERAAMGGSAAGTVIAAHAAVGLARTRPTGP